MCGLSQVNPSPVYLQTCSVCKGQFSRRNKWLIHLIQDNHQKLARLECLEKWDSELRKCSLVIYTSANLTPENTEEIVKYFSNHTSNGVTLVTDFVWWEDRPRLGILQFESREKMKEVLKTIDASNNSSKISINRCQTVQVRPASKLMELEWQAILPSYHQQTKPTTRTSNRKENVAPNFVPQLNNQQASSSTKVMEPLDLETHRPSKRLKLDNLKEPIKLSKEDRNTDRSTLSILLSNKPLASPMKPSSHPLHFQYWIIRNLMLIPDSQYAQAMLAVESLKKIIANMDPRLQLIMFRHWYLKLKYPVAKKINPENELTLYAYQPGEDSFLVDTKLREYLSTANKFHMGKIFPGIIKLVHVSTNVPLTLVTPTRKGCLMEVQLCRLLKYLCEFDPRCHPMITLACCWISSTSIKLSGKRGRGPNEPLDLPLHYTIQWLVIFFMSLGRYIPAPQDILSRNPDASVIDDVTGVNIGFRCDPNHVKEWRSRNTSGVGRARHQYREYVTSAEESSEEFILSVIQLFQKFVNFCVSTLVDKVSKILNTYNGVVIDIKELYTPNVNSRWRKAMSDSDIITLQTAFKKEKANCKLYMTHPILLSHKFELQDNIQAKLRGAPRVDLKLDKLLNNIKSRGVEQALKNIVSLEHLLTHE